MARRPPIPSAAISSTMAMFISARKLAKEVRHLAGQAGDAVTFVEVGNGAGRLEDRGPRPLRGRGGREGDDQRIGCGVPKLGHDAVEVVGVSEVRVSDYGVGPRL